MQNNMIVGVDIRDLQVAKTGQKTGLEELCKQFRLLENEQCTFIFFDTAIPVYTGKKKRRLLAEHIRYQVWKQLTLPWKAWRNRCDVVFCGDYFAPFIHLGYKTVQIFHDAFFFEYPEHYNKQWLMIFRLIAMPAARRCAFIMTTTAYAKQQIHLHTGISEHKLITISPGP
ncbi:MAG: hypothetical protein NVSMB7_13270 [Chitinophagaceae bacterium]